MDRINGVPTPYLRVPAARCMRRLAGGLMLGLSCSVQAAVVNVDTAAVYETFAEAYEAASHGETLELDDGVYALSRFALNKSVDIRAKNLGGAVIQGDGVATGYPIVISAETTLSGLRFTAATAAFSLRDHDITVRVEDAIFHGMNHGVTHQNLAGDTIGRIIITRATFYDLVEEAIYVNNGGAVQVSDAVFVDLPALGLLLGDNEGAATLQISDYALSNTANTVNNAALATLSGLVDGAPVLADPDNDYFVLLEGSAGVDEGLGIGLAAAPRVTVSVKANGQAIANGAAVTSPDNLTDFGSIHVSDNRIHQFSIENEGYADNLSLTQVLGEYLRVSGHDEDQFSILSQPTSDTIAPRSSASFEVIYTPVAVGTHQSSVVFNNDLDDPFVFSVSGVATNASPVANNDVASLDEDGTVNVPVLTNDTDADGDDLTVDSATLIAGQGTVTHQPNAVEYTPETNFNGEASISYVASDGHATDSATITLTVRPVNDAPVAADDSARTDEDTPVTIDVLANDSDVENDVLTISSATVESGGGTVAIGDGVLEFTPAADSTAEARLVYVITDGALSDSATVTVSIDAVNDPPQAAADSATTDEDTPVTIDVLANDSDPEGDALSVLSAAVVAGGGTVVVDADQLVFTPAADSTDPVTLEYDLSDGDRNAIGTVNVAITPVNDAPVAADDSATTDEDVTVVIDVLANDSDVDGDELSISSAEVVSGGGSVAIADGALTYTPAENSSDNAVLSYIVSDGELTDTGRVSVTVTAVNDTPIANDDSVTMDEDSSATIDVLANDTDAEGDALTITAASVLSGSGSVVVNGGVLEYTPAANRTDVTTLSYTVSDGKASDTGRVSVTITPINDAPIAQDDSATTDEDVTAVIDVLANDSDVDGDVLTIASAELIGGAGAVEIVNGRLEFTPAANDTAGATLGYVVSDGQTTDSATVAVSVTPVNDAPVAGNDSATATEDTAITIDALANDRDIDGDALRLISADVVAGVGEVRIESDQLVFTPAADSTEPATLEYAVSDGSLRAIGSVFIAIDPMNDAPIARDDRSRGHYLDDIVIDVLANDGDVDGDTPMITEASADQGSVTVSDNRLVFRLHGDWIPQAEINYTITDGTVEDSASVIVDLNEYQGPLVIGSGAEGASNGALADAEFRGLFSIVSGLNGQLFTASGHVLRGINIAQGIVYDIIHNEPGHRDGPHAAARFGDIEGLAYDPDNAYLYISEVSKGTIRRFDLRRDTVNTIRRGLVQPIGLALSNDRNTLYVIEHGKARVLSMDLLRGEDSVLVGNGNRGFADGVGEDARINISVGLTVGPDGTVYLADRGNSRVRAINPQTREITTLSSEFTRPSDVVVRDANTLMVLDRHENRIKRLDLRTNAVSVLASTEDHLLLPVAMDIDAAGTLYVADSANNQVMAFSIDTLERSVTREITKDDPGRGDAQQGDFAIRDIVGTGHPGTVSGLSQLANLFDPDQVVIAGDNVVFNSSRQVTLMRTDLSTGETVSLFPDYATNTLVEATAFGLGVSRWGHIDGMAYSAADNSLYVFAGRNTLFTINLDDNRFHHVTVSGLATGGDFTLAFDGSIYMVDSSGHRVVQIDPETGAILDSFGSRDGVELNFPTDIDIDSSGLLYIANWGNREVVTLDPGTGEMAHYIFRSGGFADGVLESAVIGGVYGLEIGADDVLYLADRLNHAIRMIDTAAEVPELLTIAGDSQPGLASDSGARFNNPTSLAVDASGAVVVTDDGNHRIRLISRNPSRPLVPFDTERDVLGRNEDGTAVVEGTIPVDAGAIIPPGAGEAAEKLLQVLGSLPMLFVDFDERVETLDGVTYRSTAGDISLDFPGGLNGPAFTLHGAELLMFSTEDETGVNNAFFVKVSLRRIVLSWLVALDKYDGATSRELREVVDVLPNVPLLLAYSDKNLDERAIKTLPSSLQNFFDGILSPDFGIPIFNGNGSIHAFLVNNFDSLPAMVSGPLRDLGVDQNFISTELGLDGGVLATAAVENVGTVIDVLMVLFPELRGQIVKDASAFNLPGLSAGVILPGLSLPSFMQDAASVFPLFQIIGFQPDPSVQLRFFLSVAPDLFAGAALSGSVGVEGALRANMPNILNAEALREAPGVEPLDLRINVTAAASVAAGLTNGSLGVAAADIGIEGSLQLVNYWKNPFGIQGIGFGRASVLVGGQGAVGAALQNIGAGVNLFGGISGEMACLDEDNEIIGVPENAALYIGFKVGAPPLPTGLGLERSGGPGGMTVAEQLRCRARIFNSVVLGMGDTLVGALPPGPERDAVQSIRDLGADSFAELEKILFAPLDFAPVRHVFDGARFKGNLYFATPGVALPGRFGTTGLESSGRIEVRDGVGSPWIEIADAAISITFAKGLSASFGLADYNIADLIVMDNVQGTFDLPFHNPLSANLNLTGSQTFFDLQSDTSIDMSVLDGVTIDSVTSIDQLGEVSIEGSSTGTIANWPPLGPGGGIDFAGEARFDLDTNHVADEIHGAVNHVLNGANGAYRDALNLLSSRSREEQALQQQIEELEQQINQRTREINDRLRPGFNAAQNTLSQARRHIANVYSDIRYFEGRKGYHDDRCGWQPWTWDHCAATAYWWGREKFARGQVWAANRAIDLAAGALRGAESALNSALDDVARTLSPRLNAYRVAIVGLRTARDLAAISVRALQAANNEVQNIGNALRDAANIQVHDASARIDSLFNVYAGLEGVHTHTDIEVLNLRCRSNIEVNLQLPVETLLGGIQEIQRACIEDLHGSASSQRKAVLTKQYFARKLQVGSESPGATDNDDVASAQIISAALPLQIAADNSGAGTAEDEFASDLTSNTLWWRWQPPAAGVYRIRAVSALTDTTLQLHRAGTTAPGTATLVAADFIPSSDAQLQVSLDGAEEVLIGVGSQLGLPGAFTLQIEALGAVSPPPNDDLAGAIAVSGLGGSTGQSNLGATVETGEHTGDALPVTATIWWKLNVARAGLYTINTLGSEVDTVLRAYRSAGGSVVSVGDLDWQKTADDISIDPRSELTIFAQAGDVLWFSVGSKDANGGEIDFNWQHTALNAAQLRGDDFAEAIVLDAARSGQVRSNVGATTEAGEPMHAATSNTASLWVRFTAPETGNYLFDTTGSRIDTALAIYAGDSLDELTELASSNGARAQASLLNRVSYSAFRVNLTQGEVYHLAQAGIDEAEGDVVLNVQRFSLNDRFEQPITLGADGAHHSAEVSEAQLQDQEPDYAEILARDFTPDTMLASLSGLTDSAQDAGVELAIDDGLLATLESLHEGALADLRSRPARHSLWYRFTATQAGDLHLNTLGSEPDTALVVFAGDALGELQAVAWNDDIDNGTDSRLRYPVEPGRSYAIALLAREAGVVQLAANLVTPEQQTVANGRQENSILLAGNAGRQTGDNTYAAADAELEKPVRAQDGQRLWWRFDATTAGTLVVDTQGSDSDTVLEVYVDRFGTLARTAFNDNFHPELNTSRVRVNVEAGRSYWIAVDTVNRGAGAVRLNYRLDSTAAAPTNDRIAQAQIITGEVFATAASNVFAQHQQDEPFIGSALRPNSVWYQWTPSVSGLATISTQGSAIDTLLGLYLGSQPSDLQLLESGDDSDGDTASVIRTHVVAGASYFIAIAGKRDVQGSYALSIAVADGGGAQADNNRIATAEAVTGRTPRFGLGLTHALPDTDTGSALVEASGQEASSRWWHWRAPKDGVVILSSRGSELVPQLEIYAGETAQSIVLLDADKGSGEDGAFSQVTAAVKAGQRYFVRVSSPFSFQGAVELAIDYTDTPVPDATRLLTGDRGSVAAAITGAGTTVWTWAATDNGLAQFALSRGRPADHRLRVFAAGSPTLEIANARAEADPDAAPADAEAPPAPRPVFQFETEKGASYRIEVSSSQALHGNAELAYGYINRKAIDLGGAAGQRFVASVKPLVTISDDGSGTQLATLAATDAALTALLTDLLQGSTLSPEQLEVGLSVHTPGDAPGDAPRLRFVARNASTAEIVISAVFKPDASAAVIERHDQVLVDSPGFTELVFDSPSREETVGVQMGLGSFNQAVAQAFVSAEQLEIGDQLAVASPDLLLGARAYRISLDLYDSAGQRYPLETDQSVLRSVQVRLPVDVEVLLNWLGIDGSDPVEAQRLIDLAVDQGVLQVHRGATVAALLAGQSTALTGALAIDLAAGDMTFTTDHFSSFALAAAQPAAAIDRNPVREATVSVSAGAVDEVVLWGLLLLLAIRLRTLVDRRGSSWIAA